MESKKVYVCVTVGRQMEGDIINIRYDKCFSNKEAAEKYLKDQAKVRIETLKTDFGMVEFYCERGLHELDVED